MNNIINSEILDYLEEMVIVLDNDYRIIKINKSAENNLYFIQNTSIGKNLFELFKNINIKLPFTEKDIQRIPVNDCKLFDYYLDSHRQKHQNILWKIIKKESDNELLIYIIGATEHFTLKESYKYIKNILEQLPEYIYWKDANFVYQGCNTHVANYLNLKNPSEIIGKTDLDFGWSKERIRELNRVDIDIITKGITNTVEDIIPYLSGEHRIMLTSKSPLYDDRGTIIGILGISTDITDRKKMEQELLEAIQAKNTFLSIASHEIKGPLTNSIYILKSVTESLAKNDQSKLEKLKPLFVAQIQDSQRGIDTINFLLDFLNLDLIGTNLSEINEIALPRRMSEIIDTFETRATNDIEFHIIKDEDFPRVVFLPKEIDKIIEILIANAVKYSRHQGIINVKLNHFMKNNKNYLTISVEDNGSGINKDTLDRFFVPLLSGGKKDGERIYSSPAIKLSYIKKFLELLGGELTIESEEGMGTTVSITLPYEKSFSDYKASVVPDTFGRSKQIEQAATSRKLNFLIVEDNPLTLELLKTEIGNLGHHVDVAANGYDALKLAKENNYEVIFLDISLPGMDGVELREKLSKVESDLPIIIAITSHDSRTDQNYFLDKGFVTVIGKPFSKEKIIKCIDSIQKVLIDLGY